MSELTTGLVKNEKKSTRKMECLQMNEQRSMRFIFPASSSKPTSHLFTVCPCFLSVLAIDKTKSPTHFWNPQGVNYLNVKERCLYHILKKHGLPFCQYLQDWKPFGNIGIFGKLWHVFIALLSFIFILNDTFKKGISLYHTYSCHHNNRLEIICTIVWKQ